jgi:polyisoprenyl-phosphate glycosyltransferase
VISVVAPMLNEAALARTFCDRVRAALEGEELELVVVDDGSTDGTTELLAELAAEDPRIRVVELSRNFGHQAAMTAGLDHATGDAVITMDADLQDPPEVLPALVERWRAGAEVVHAVRTSRPGETRFKTATASAFYRGMGRLAQVELQPDSGDFRLLDRRAADVLRALPERNRYLRGLAAWVGFTQAVVPYDREPRTADRTKWTLRRMVRFALDAVTSFSNVPLQVATVIGFVFAALALVAIPVAIGFRIADQFVPGVTTTIIAVLLLGGIQLMAIGVIGEYVGRIYDEVKARPLYVVRRTR